MIQFPVSLKIWISVLYLFQVWFVFNSCVQPKKEFESVPLGPWRGVLLLDRSPVVKYGDDRDIKKNFDFDSELAFTFDIGKDSLDKLFVEFYNGSEKIRIYDVTMGKKTISSKDTLHIDFIEYDTYINAIYEDGIMEGKWIVNYKENYSVPFKAVFGQNHRFDHKTETSMFDISGKWKTTFQPGKQEEYPAIGDFTQEGNIVRGTFLTETGDYRFLDGNIIKNKLYLSAFDGAHAFLFVGKFTHKDSLIGSFRSGINYTEEWIAHKDESFTLSDPFQLTSKSSDNPLNFVFPNTENQMVSINDNKYKNKIKIVQIMGTWCPNCYDETVMLKDYFKTSPSDEVAWISLGFERYKEKEKSIKQLAAYKNKMGLTHEVLWAGYYKKEEAIKSIPQLSEIKSYPTLLIIDQQNKIRHIHTGFSGPATKEYTKFKSDFENLINSLKDEGKKR
ncbi:MAG: redoxin domain-containing protein [Saprospiraceae bacterium]|nr:redoxin domain-containing protein [Saprospiraceae bacterium]